MPERPRIPRPRKLFAIILILLLLVIGVIFVGRNISHYHEEKGATREPPSTCGLNC